MPSIDTSLDQKLGMGADILRRDFLNGAAIAVGAIGVAGSAAAAPVMDASMWAQDLPGYYPPTRQGLRGTHPGAFEAAHALRDGVTQTKPIPLAETYDLIVVGAGISGLSAAHFWRQKHPDAKILILDNHDDFGGHAKRNEIVINGHPRLMNGGTLQIDSPRPYSPVAEGLLKSLDVDAEELSKKCEDHAFYRRRGMGMGYFFDAATFGEDRLVAGIPTPKLEDGAPPDGLDAFVDLTPLNPKAKADLKRLLLQDADPWPALSADQKKDRLSRISYQSFLEDVLKMDPQVVAMWRTSTQGEWTVGIDAVSALDCWGFGLPGFAGMKLPPTPTDRMSYTPKGYIQGGSATFHFPDGNASIARLLVRSLIPNAISGSTGTDIVTAKADYAQLDKPENAVRIRLSTTVTKVKHNAEPDRSTHVEVTYMRGGKAWSVAGAKVVLACYNMIIPYLAPELPEPQKAALHELVKEPLVYVTVAIRNWTAFEQMKISSVHAPSGYFTAFGLDPIVEIGDYKGATDPSQPTLIRMTRTPCAPGLPEHDQNRLGRAELLTTTFETFEREIRSQLGHILSPAGFDPAKDITAIIVNRWPHGYAPERNFLWEDVVPEDQTPQVVGRQRFGRIAIANSDCGGGAYTDVAIDMAYRAVAELG
jgi:spermidine dehydrogenase